MNDPQEFREFFKKNYPRIEKELLKRFGRKPDPFEILTVLSTEWDLSQYEDNT